MFIFMMHRLNLSNNDVSKNELKQDRRVRLHIQKAFYIIFLFTFLFCFGLTLFTSLLKVNQGEKNSNVLLEFYANNYYEHTEILRSPIRGCIKFLSSN